MQLTLHGIAGSRAIRCLWMLEELGVPYTHVPTDFRGQTRTPEFLSTHPSHSTRINELTNLQAVVQPLYAKAAKP